jgi:Rit1 N-terminal domain
MSEERAIHPSQHVLRRRMHGYHHGVLNHLRSIVADSKFVDEFLDLDVPRQFPVFGNLRCGRWYINQRLHPDRSRVYFKSSDGHYDSWAFSLTRLNLHAIVKGFTNYKENILSCPGFVVVDSTKQGKLFPDSLSKTIPLWACVLNKIMFPSLSFTESLFLPSWVPPSERSEIIKYIETLFSLNIIPNSIIETIKEALSNHLPYPLRCEWFSSEFENNMLLESISSSETKYFRILCVSASRRVPDRGDVISQHAGWYYIQGAGDDEEFWCPTIKTPYASSNVDDSNSDSDAEEEEDGEVEVDLGRKFAPSGRPSSFNCDIFWTHSEEILKCYSNEECLEKINTILQSLSDQYKQMNYNAKSGNDFIYSNPLQSLCYKQFYSAKPLISNSNVCVPTPFPVSDSSQCCCKENNEVLREDPPIHVLFILPSFGVHENLRETRVFNHSFDHTTLLCPFIARLSVVYVPYDKTSLKHSDRGKGFQTQAFPFVKIAVQYWELENTDQITNNQPLSSLQILFPSTLDRLPFHAAMIATMALLQAYTSSKFDELYEYKRSLKEKAVDGELKEEDIITSNIATPLLIGKQQTGKVAPQMKLQTVGRRLSINTPTKLATRRSHFESELSKQDIRAIVAKILVLMGTEGSFPRSFLKTLNTWFFSRERG